MATFDKAYPFTKKYEGGYANIPGDLGGETYAGISRKYHPEEKDLWTSLDFYKRTSNGVIENGTILPGLNEIVKDFYLRLWNKNRLSELNDQGIATTIFDYIVHKSGMHGRAAQKQVQRLVKVSDDGIFGPITIAAINKEKPSLLISNLLNLREKELIAQAQNPSQAKFLDGWLARIDNLFQTFVKGSESYLNGGTAAILLILLLLIFLL